MIGRNRIRQTQDVVLLQYANGKSMARPTTGSARFSAYVGFHIETGRDTELDTILGNLNTPQIEIKHQRQGGAEIVRHWNFGERIHLYPITSGPVATTVASSLGRHAQATAQAGIGLRWGSGERSKMAIRGYIEPLVKAGHTRLVQFSVRSRMSDVLLTALLDHARVCEAADHLIDRAKHTDIVSFHEIALPLGPGSEEEWGKSDTATVVPFISQHPATIDNNYLRTVWRSDGVHLAALRDWEEIQTWAQEYQLANDEPPRVNEEAMVSSDDT